MASTKHPALKALDKAERKVNRVMRAGTEADACTIPGQEGKNYITWCAAADACHAYRKAHDLIGTRGY